MRDIQNKPGRPYRSRQLKDGRRVPLKRPDARANAMPRRVFPVHGGAAKVLRHGVLDARSALGRGFFAETTALRSHIGGEPTLPEVRLIEQAGRLHLIGAMAWAELLAAGRLIGKTGAHPAVDVLVRVMREQRAVLELLGLKRRPKDVPDLTTYLAQKAAERANAPDEQDPDHV